jgi:peptide/nickel transport system substrate-binding protein
MTDQEVARALLALEADGDPTRILPAATRRDVMRLLMAGGLGLAAGALPGFVPAARADTPKRGGHIRVAGYASSTADTLDPAHASNSTDYSRLFMFYNGLTVFDQHLTPLPDLATSVETKDAKVWTVKLRKGVTFHDGSPFTADDVVFSLMRHKDPKTSSVVRPLAEQFDSIKATAPDEVTITLTAPNSELPTILAIYQFVIVKNGTTDFSKGNGTGPFLCKEFSPGVRSIAVRNPNYYHPGRPYLDQVEFFGITNNAARVNALLSGDIDIASGIDAVSTRQVKAAKGFEVFETKGGNYTDLIMHLDNTQTGNPDFVMAMKYLQDRQRIKSSIFLDYATIGNDQPIDPTNPYYDPGLPQRPLDIDKAKFHLKKAGMAGATIPLVCSPAATGSVDMAVILQDTARQAGLNIDLRRVPADGYWSNYWLKAPFTYGNINPRPTANILLTLFFKSTAPWNESKWKNESFDKMLDEARSETDLAKRKQLYAEMQKMISDEAGIGIPVFISGLDAHSARVKGMYPVPTGGLMGFNFAQNIWLDG